MQAVWLTFFFSSGPSATEFSLTGVSRAVELGLHSAGKNVGKSEIAANYIGDMADTVSARVKRKATARWPFFVGASDE